MRLHHLEITAFGPFPDCVEVDFDQLSDAGLFLLTGPTAYESALLDLMERIVADYPTLRLFSLPSLAGKERKHLELGVEGAPALVDKAMEEIRREVERRSITWVWRS